VRIRFLEVLAHMFESSAKLSNFLNCSHASTLSGTASIIPRNGTQRDHVVALPQQGQPNRYEPPRGETRELALHRAPGAQSGPLLPALLPHANFGTSPFKRHIVHRQLHQVDPAPVLGPQTFDGKRIGNRFGIKTLPLV
jgi:hypothetical protein